MKRHYLQYMIKFMFVFLLINSAINCSVKTVTQTGSKNEIANRHTQQIQGLWKGTYTVGEGQSVPPGTQFYFSFSIYPDGTMHYKGKGYYNGSSDYITFADGTWSLSGTKFTFNVITVNLAGYGPQHRQTGTATFNHSKGTLTNGTITDMNKPENKASWSMSRVE